MVALQVDARDYPGVTHEFFGMGKVVATAKDAEDVAIKNLKRRSVLRASCAGSSRRGREPAAELGY